MICSNIIGSCYGSTGPASINPATGKPYGLAFPVVTIGDMVRGQERLIDHLGIERLLCVVGGSMGGMQALEWAAHHPERIRAAIPLATTARSNAMQIALSEVGRQAIYADPTWQGGDYYESDHAARRRPGRGAHDRAHHLPQRSRRCTRSSAAACRIASSSATSSRPSSRWRAI